MYDLLQSHRGSKPFIVSCSCPWGPRGAARSLHLTATSHPSHPCTVTELLWGTSPPAGTSASAAPRFSTFWSTSLVPTPPLPKHHTLFKYCCFNNLHHGSSSKRRYSWLRFLCPPSLPIGVPLLLQTLPRLTSPGSCRPRLGLILLIILHIKHNATDPLLLL